MKTEQTEIFELVQFNRKVEEVFLNVSKRYYVGTSEEELVGVGNTLEAESNNVWVGGDVNGESHLPPYMDPPDIPDNDGAGVGAERTHLYNPEPNEAEDRADRVINNDGQYPGGPSQFEALKM